MDGTDFLNLLYITLKALLKPSLDNRLIRRIYELRVLVLIGEYPQVFSCAKCGKKQDLYYFSIRQHGALCPECLKGEYAVPLDASALYAMQYIMTEPFQKLYTFTLSDPVFACLDQLVSGYIRQHQDHTFKSEEML